MAGILIGRDWGGGFGQALSPDTQNLQSSQMVEPAYWQKAELVKSFNIARGAYYLPKTTELEPLENIADENKDFLTLTKSYVEGPALELTNFYLEKLIWFLKDRHDPNNQVLKNYTDKANEAVERSFNKTKNYLDLKALSAGHFNSAKYGQLLATRYANFEEQKIIQSSKIYYEEYNNSIEDIKFTSKNLTMMLVSGQAGVLLYRDYVTELEAFDNRITTNKKFFNTELQGRHKNALNDYARYVHGNYSSTTTGMQQKSVPSTTTTALMVVLGLIGAFSPS